MTGFAEFARFAGLYQTPSNTGQHGDCLGQWLSYHLVTVNGRASPVPHGKRGDEPSPLLIKFPKGFAMFGKV